MDDNNNSRNKLKTPWKNFALRAQNVQRPEDTPAIIQMTVLINRDGNPVLWTAPKVIPLEPRVEFDLTALNDQFTPEELLELLHAISANT